MENITCVSFFFDIGKLENNDKRRQANNYKNTSEELLRRDMNLIFFGEQDTVKHVWTIRKKYNLLHKTYLVTCELNESPYYKYLPLLTEYSKTVGLNGFVNDIRMTPHYFVAIWSKFYFIKKAIELNPFESNKFCWIDYGIFHISEKIDDDKFANNLLSLKSDKIKIMMIFEGTQQLLNDRKLLYSKDRHITTAQIFGGGKDIFLKYIELFDEELMESIKCEKPTNEENIMAMLAMKFTKMFEYGFALYALCLVNFNKIEEEEKMCLNIISKWRENGFEEIACQLLENLKHKEGRLSNDLVYKLYSELIIVSYYTRGVDKYREYVKEFKLFCLKNNLVIDKYTENNLVF